MKKIIAVAGYTFIENLRQRVFYSLIVFAPVIFFASWILSAIGGEQRVRVLGDFGFALSDFAALWTAIFIGANFIYDEIENKSIYIVLARPVSKFSYILGRYLGFLLTSVVLLFFMAGLTLVSVKLAGGALSPKIVALPALSALKIAAILSVSVFFAMLTTSKAASMSFALFFWVAGHFSAELEFLSRLAASRFVQILAFVVKFAAPQLSKFSPLAAANIEETGLKIIFGYLGTAAVYTTIYSAAFVIASFLVFRRKEF